MKKSLIKRHRLFIFSLLIVFSFFVNIRPAEAGFFSDVLNFVKRIRVVITQPFAAGPEIKFYKDSSLVNSITCGETFRIEIENYDEPTVWLYQEYQRENNQERQKRYEGPFPKSLTHTSTCDQDEGVYDHVFYYYSQDKKGELIGSFRFTINPLPSLPPPTLPPQQPTSPPPTEAPESSPPIETLKITPPIEPTSCSISVNQTAFKIGETINWSINSDPQGRDAYWFGTGITDPNGIFAGETPYNLSYIFQDGDEKAGDNGNYIRYVKIKDDAGAVACETGQISISVIKPIPPPTVLPLATTILPPPITATTPPPVAVSCSITVNKRSFNIDETINWTITSNPPSYDAYWFGTGITDTGGVRAGITPYNLSYKFISQDVGNFQRYAKIKDSQGKAVCETEKVAIEVKQPLPVVGSISASLSPAAPPSKEYSAGARDVEFSRFRLAASNEGFFVEQLGFTTDVPNGTSNVKSVTLKYKDRPSADKRASSVLDSNGLVRFSFTGNDRPYIPKDGSVDLLILADLKTKEEGAKGLVSFAINLDGAKVRVVGETSGVVKTEVQNVNANQMSIAPLPVPPPISIAATPTPTPTATIRGRVWYDENGDGKSDGFVKSFPEAPADCNGLKIGSDVLFLLLDGKDSRHTLKLDKCNNDGPYYEKSVPVGDWQMRLILTDLATGSWKLISPSPVSVTADKLKDGAEDVWFGIQKIQAITAPVPSIKLVSPNGGGEYTGGGAMTIEYCGQNFSPSTPGGIAHIYLMQNNSVVALISNTQSGVTSCSDGPSIYSWKVGQFPENVPNQIPADGLRSGSYKILVDYRDSGGRNIASDQSDSIFSITSGSNTPVAVVAPNGGEQWLLDSIQTIRWSDSGPSGQTYTIHITQQNGNSYGVAAHQVFDKNEFSWKVGELLGGQKLNPGNNYYVQIVKQYVPYPILKTTDQGDNAFSITSPTVVTGSAVTVTSPNGGEVWRIGKEAKVTWQRNWMPDGAGGLVDIFLKRIGSSLFSQFVAGGVSDSSGFTWLVPNSISFGSDYKIVVTSRGFGGSPSAPLSDESNGVFVVSDIHTPSTPQIAGPTSVVQGKSNTYTFSSSDSEGHRIKYEIDWGDGSKDTDKPPQFGPLTLDHTYNLPGIFNITVIAFDYHPTENFPIGNSATNSLFQVKVSEITTPTPTATIRGRVWYDENGDGVKDGFAKEDFPDNRNCPGLILSDGIPLNFVNISKPGKSIGAALRKCNSGGPYYEEKVEIDNWEVSFRAPSGWKLISSSPIAVSVSQLSDGAEDVWFGIQKVQTVVQPKPEVFQVTPNSAFQGDTVNVRITGKNFSSTKDLSGNGISPVSKDGFRLLSSRLISDTEIEATFGIDANAAIGKQTILVGGSETGPGFIVLLKSKPVLRENPAVKVAFPNGGETWLLKKEMKINWQNNYIPQGGSGLAEIYLLKDSQSTPIFIAGGANPSFGVSGIWDLLPADDYRILVLPLRTDGLADLSFIQLGDTSDKTFSVSGQTITSISITGPTSVIANTKETYKFFAQSNTSESSLIYKVNWGDGLVDQTKGPNGGSPEGISLTHSWVKEGIYDIVFTAASEVFSDAFRFITHKIKVSADVSPKTDLAVESIKVNPPNPEADKDFTVDVVLKNVGGTVVSKPAAELNIYNSTGTRVYSVATGPAVLELTPNTSVTITFHSDLFNPRTAGAILNFPAGTYKMVGRVNFPKDDNPGNDSVTATLNIVSSPVIIPPSEKSYRVFGRVFYDEDADGIYDPEEKKFVSNNLNCSDSVLVKDAFVQVSYGNVVKRYSINKCNPQPYYETEPIPENTQASFAISSSPDSPWRATTANPVTKVITKDEHIWFGMGKPVTVVPVPTHGPVPPTTGFGNIIGRVVYDSNSNGKFDSGEKFIQIPGSNCVDSFDLQLDINLYQETTDTIISASPNRCNNSGAYYKFLGVAAGNYQSDPTPAPYTLTVLVPAGWKVTNVAPDNPEVKDGQTAHVWIYVNKLPVQPPDFVKNSLTSAKSFSWSGLNAGATKLANGNFLYEGLALVVLSTNDNSVNINVHMSDPAGLNFSQDAIIEKNRTYQFWATEHFDIKKPLAYNNITLTVNASAPVYVISPLRYNSRGEGKDIRTAEINSLTGNWSLNVPYVIEGNKIFFPYAIHWSNYEEWPGWDSIISITNKSNENASATLATRAVYNNIHVREGSSCRDVPIVDKDVTYFINSGRQQSVHLSNFLGIDQVNQSHNSETALIITVPDINTWEASVKVVPLAVTSKKFCPYP